ncbi:MAG: response regulator [Coriobacteriales bacterium]|jgi:signal transduction histidine kinase/CheY-like chemotaxis protein|nr:response regulator [Coriobacteriales bacterium]
MKSVRLKYFLVVLSIVIAISFASTGVSTVFSITETTAALQNDLLLDNAIGDKLIANEITLLKTETEKIAVSLGTAAEADLESSLREQLDSNSRFLALTVINHDGMISTAEADQSHEQYMDTIYVQHAFEGLSVISTTRFTETGDVVMHVCVPVKTSAGPGVLAATVHGLHFMELLSQFNVYKSGHFFMLDEEGTIIASKSDESVLSRKNYIQDYQQSLDPSQKPLAEFFETAISGNKGVTTYSADGREVMGAYQPISNSLSGWTIGVFVPIDETPVITSRNVIIMSGLIIILLGLIVAVVISKKMAEPYERIIEQNENLTILRKEASEASEAKSSFLANMSHEMRTPLNAVIGLTQIVLDDDLSDVSPEIVSNVKKVNASGMMLLSLVNDILDLSKIEAGKLELIQVKYDVPSLINDTTVLNAVRIGSKPIEFVLDIEDTLPNYLFGDDLRVKQILNNLLSNAFKYTEKGTVTFKLRSKTAGEKVILTADVIDTGVGIRPEHIGKLFGNYNQVDTAAHRKTEGTGLGLSIALQLAKMMNGDITVQSEYGVGTTFSVTLEQTFVTDTPIGKTVADNLRNFDSAFNKQIKSSGFQRISMPYAKVLLIDDVSTNLDVAKGLMKKYDTHIDTATSGQAAIDIVTKAEIKYDAIFMDHMMPEMDGVEATWIIRNNIDSDYARNVPIIAFTANAIEGSRDMFLKNGFDDFVSKPIDIKELDGVLRKWVRDKDKEALLTELDAKAEESIAPKADAEDTANRATGQEQEAIWHIDGIDIQALLGRFADNKDDVLEVLESYSRNTPELLKTVSQPTTDNLKDYAVAVHGIKGSSRNVCAEDIGKQAEALEFAAKASDLQFVEQNNPALLRAVDILLAELTAFLQETRGQENKPIASAPDPRLLERLTVACSAFNMDEADQIIKLLDNNSYQVGQEVVDLLKEQIGGCDFDAACETISGYITQ